MDAGSVGYRIMGWSKERARTNLYVQDSYLGICAARDGCGVFLADRVEVSTDLRNGSLVALGGQDRRSSAFPLPGGLDNRAL